MNAPLSFAAKVIVGPPWLIAREELGPSYGRATETSAKPETIGDWREVHARVVELGAERAGHERELCRWLLAAERLGVHTRAGHASLREYADRVIGLGGRQTEERLRVGRALAGLPVLDEALAKGELCWSVVRELSRVATAGTEKAWRAWAKGRRSREIEQAVAARHRGDRPEDRGDPSLVKHRLRFEVRAETMALFRDAQAVVRAQLGGDVDDDVLLYELARRVLAGPGDEGRASYQVAVTRCEDCGRTSIDAGGQGHPVDDVVAEMAACDAQHIGRVGGSMPRTHTGAPTHDGCQLRGVRGSRETPSAPPASPAPTRGRRPRRVRGRQPHPRNGRGRRRPFLRPRGVRSCAAIGAAAWCPGAGITSSSTCIISTRAPKAGVTTPTASRLSAVHTTGLSTWVTCASRERRARASRSATPTGRPMARLGLQRASSSRASRSPRFRTWASAPPGPESSSTPCWPWTPFPKTLATSFAQHCGQREGRGATHCRQG